MPEGVGYAKKGGKKAPLKIQKPRAAFRMTETGNQDRRPKADDPKKMETRRKRMKASGDRSEARKRRTLNPKSLTSRRVRDALTINKAAKKKKDKLAKRTKRLYEWDDKFLNIMVKSAVQSGRAARGKRNAEKARKYGR